MQDFSTCYNLSYQSNSNHPWRSLVSIDINRVQALCFDVDGTLSDTDDKWTHTLARMLQPLRLIIPGGDVEHLARWLIMGFESPGNWLYDMLDRVGLDDEAAKLISTLSHIRRDSVQKNFLLVPGVSQMLAFVRKSLFHGCSERPRGRQYTFFSEPV